jgi:hypothetical protein
MPNPKRKQFLQQQRKKRLVDRRKLKVKVKSTVGRIYVHRERERNDIFKKIRSHPRFLWEFGELVTREKNEILKKRVIGKKITNEDAVLLAAQRVLDQILDYKHPYFFELVYS